MTTNLMIYVARRDLAQARIASDREAGRGATKLDLYRLSLNQGLIRAELQRLADLESAR